MLGLGLFVFLRNPKRKLAIVFLFFCLVMANWLLSTFIMYKSKTDAGAIFWDRMVYLGVVFIPVLMYHFGLIFTNSENKKKLYLGYFLSFIFFILSRTDYFVADLYKYSWGVHTQARFFHHLFLVFFFFYILSFLMEIYKLFKITKEKKEIAAINQAKYLFMAFVTLDLGAYAYLAAYGIDINPIGAYWLEIIAVSILAFAITKYHLFEIKVLLTELLVGAMGFIWLIFIFLAPSSSLKSLAFFTFILFCLFGYYLVKAVHEESKRREDAEKIAVQENALRRKAEKIASEYQLLNETRNNMFLVGHHHARTPLAHVKNFTSMLLEEVYGPLNKEQKWALQNILNKAQESVDLANLYLEVAELEAGKSIISKEKAVLERVVSKQIKKLSMDAKLNKVEIKTDFENDLSEAAVDAEKIGTVFYTLIDNALKYTPQKTGKIIVGLKKGKDGKILFSCRDNGIGIEKEKITNLGKIAYQRSNQAKGINATGKGLALYLSNLIVKAHKGRFWAESEGKGKGATFYVELPIK